MSLILGRIEIDCLMNFGAQSHFNDEKHEML